MAKIPDLVKLDPTALQNQAVQFDTQGYNASDADYAKRFPDLVAARDYSISNAAASLGGAQDPNINSALSQSGIGPVDLGSNSFQQSKNLGQPILAQEQRNRNYFETLFKENPQRTFGLSPGDIANVALANSGAQTQFNATALGSKINQLNAQSQQAAQLGAVASQLTGNIVGPVANYISQPSDYLSSNYYNPGFAPSSAGGAYEGTISGQPVYRATPVNSTTSNTGGF